MVLAFGEPLKKKYNFIASGLCCWVNTEIAAWGPKEKAGRHDYIIWF